MTREVIFPQRQGNADPHTSSALVRAAVNQQPVWSSNFIHQIIGVSVSPLPSASPESKLHSHCIWQGTQPTAAHSYHSHLYDVPISYTRAGTFHLPNFTTNFCKHQTGIGKASTALQWYGYTVVWQRTGLPISGTRNQHAKTGASRDTTVLTCFCYVNLPLSWGGNQLESQTEHRAGQETYSQDRMLQCTDIAQRSYSL